MQEPAEQDKELDALALCSSLITGALLASLLVAQRAWVLNNRTYPHIPLIDSFSLGIEIESFLYSVLLIALIAFNFLTRKMLIASIFFIAISLTVMLDVTRLQPWLYLLTAMFMLCSMRWKESKNGDTNKSTRKILDALRICLIGTYFFAGVQKLNLNFCRSVVPSLLHEFLQALPTSLGFALGIFLASVEASIALLLVIPKTRKLGAVISIGFHLITLLLITGRNWNAVVWPWNIAMILLVYLLFLRTPTGSAAQLLAPSSPKKVVAISLFLILPILNFFGKWDNYLSSALYSGNVPVLRIAVAETDNQSLNSSIREAIDISDPQKPTLIIERWALGELGIPPYPEVSQLENLAGQIMKSGRFTRSRFYIETFPRFFNGENCIRTVSLSATEP